MNFASLSSVRLFEFVFRAGRTVVSWACKTLLAFVMALISFVIACKFLRYWALARRARARSGAITAPVATLRVLCAVIVVATGVAGAAAAVLPWATCDKAGAPERTVAVVELHSSSPWVRHRFYRASEVGLHDDILSASIIQHGAGPQPTSAHLARSASRAPAKNTFKTHPPALPTVARLTAPTPTVVRSSPCPPPKTHLVIISDLSYQ